MKERILITGATGNIGREIVGRLLDRQASFVAASHVDSTFPPEVKHVKLDFAERSLVGEVTQGIDVMLLILPISESMLLYAQNAILAAKQSGVRFMILTSILGADPDSQFMIHQLHGQIEEMAKESRIPLVILRPNIFMQSFLFRHGESIRNGALFLPEGEAKSSFIDIRDIADVTIKVIENPWQYEGRTISLTGPEALSNEEALDKISRVVGRRIAYVSVTEQATRHRLLRERMNPWMVEAILSLHRSIREGLMAHVHPNNEQVRGVAPRSFDGFVKEVSASWRSYADALREANL